MNEGALSVVIWIDLQDVLLSKKKGKDSFCVTIAEKKEKRVGGNTGFSIFFLKKSSKMDNNSFISGHMKEEISRRRRETIYLYIFF